VSTTKQTAVSDPREGVADSRFRWTRTELIKTVIGLGLVAGLIALATNLGNNPEFGNTAALSLLIGTALGIVFERGRFCFFCIFRDSIENGVTTGIISVLVALATGAIGYSLVFALFLPVPNGEYLPPAAHIGPISWALVAGAAAFGLGMVLSGACIAGHMYRLGQGSLRAVPSLFGVVLGFGLALVGWNDIYLGQIQEAPVVWLPDLVGYNGALLLTLLAIGVLAIVAIRFTKKQDRNFEALDNPFTLRSIAYSLLRKRWSPGVTGTIVGLIGTFAYLRIEPLGVTRQIGSTTRTLLDSQGVLPEMLHGLDTLAGCIGVVTETITNNGWVVLGIVISSFAAALAGGRFKFEPLTLKGSLSGILGGVLLGWGAMISLGCTIGVLLSGIQAFSVAGWVFAVVMFAAVFVGIKLKLHRFN
jgi:uncharacterized membrane protein YedE/YeeE